MTNNPTVKQDCMNFISGMFSGFDVLKFSDNCFISASKNKYEKNRPNTITMVKQSNMINPEKRNLTGYELSLRSEKNILNIN